jgi:hypothetical protein
VRFLHLVRLITSLVAVAYCCDSLPIEWIYWLEEHFSSAGAIYETGVSSLTTAGEIGVYITAPAAVLIVFIAVPRFRWGVPALSWCFLLMGACLLSNLYRCYWDRYLSAVVQIVCYGQQLSFALSPLIIGLLLRCRFIARQLQIPPSDGVNAA